MNKNLFYLITFFWLIVSVTNSWADQLEAHEIDFANISQQAELANAAYQSESQIRELSNVRGIEVTALGTIADIQIGYFLTTDRHSQQQTIAVRGTSNIENAMVDITLKLVLDEYSGLYLHSGFAHAAQQVYKSVKPLLNKDFKIETTGHSLGGAVAVILAIYLDRDGYQISQTTTFGQPKVTNLGGANTLEHLNIIRVVTPRDLVPLVPLFDPLDINNLDIFWHAGKEVVLLDENKFAILTGINSMLRATRFTQQTPDEENLRHHTMQLYLDLLGKRIDSAEQVDYENSFNLFNLFGSD